MCRWRYDKFHLEPRTAVAHKHAANGCAVPPRAPGVPHSTHAAHPSRCTVALPASLPPSISPMPDAARTARRSTAPATRSSRGSPKRSPPTDVVESRSVAYRILSIYMHADIHKMSSSAVQSARPAQAGCMLRKCISQCDSFPSVHFWKSLWANTKQLSR